MGLRTLVERDERVARSAMPGRLMRVALWLVLTEHSSSPRLRSADSAMVPQGSSLIVVIREPTFSAPRSRP